MSREDRPGETIDDKPAGQRRIVIAGNIGAGKTTLARMLSARFGWPVDVEPAAENPWLRDFYSDMSRWALESQLWFLAARLERESTREDRGSPLLEDRSIYEDAEVFARNLALAGHMTDRQWDLYSSIYRSACQFIAPPGLVVFLDAPVSQLEANIAKRGREFEGSVPREYLKQLDARYQEWIASFGLAPIFRIDLRDVDFVASKRDQNDVENAIESKLKTLKIG